MELTIQGQHIDVDDATRGYVQRKLTRVGRHISHTMKAAVHLDHQQTRRVDQRYCAQVTLDVNGSVLRSQERGLTAQAAIDAATDSLDRRLRRLKARLYRSERGKRTGESIRFDEPEERREADAAEEEAEGAVVRTKRFPMKPMTVEEAAFEMENLGHSFFLFLNSEERTYGLLYKRGDGGYGLIFPEAL